MINKNRSQLRSNMKEYHYSKGEIIHKAGDSADTLDYIVSGKVSINADGLLITAKKNSILGILEQAENPYSYNYIADTDVTILSYPFTRFSDVNAIIEDHFKDCDLIITSTANLIITLLSKYRQLKKNSDRFYDSIVRYYARYKELCGIHGFDVQSFPFLENTESFVPGRSMPDWISDYYDQLEIMPLEAKKAFFSTHSSLTTATIWEASSHAKMYLSLAAQQNEYFDDICQQYFYSPSADLFDLYQNLLTKAKGNQDLIMSICDSLEDMIDEFDSNLLIPKDVFDKKADANKELINNIRNSISNTEDNGDENNEDNANTITELTDKYACIKNSLDIILRYTDTDDAEDDRFRDLISKFKSLKDKNSNDSDAASLRQDITKSFIDIYESAIISSFDAAKTPTVLKMFFNFGYMDEELIGLDNALYLYNLSEKINLSDNKRVYTIYDWLKAIYKGEIEPSKNEIDQDYPAYIKAQVASGYIASNMEAIYLKSNKEKLRFEIRNFFKTTLRVCSGRPSTFCPVLSDHNIIKPLETILVSGEKITKNWAIIRAIDFSAFYRPCMFQSKEYHISRETVLIEVLPITILMPVIGSKALLWQELSDARRTTPGRIALPVFTEDDLFLIQAKLTGEFRWEICKRIQGSRWNDVSERSLTSDYFDYLQFYKKNTDLSPDAKEKIRTQIANSRNNFKNVFISDYISWIRYEALGSPRLNKTAKYILFNYIPFSKKIRDTLRTNPMYESLISKHENKAAKEVKLLTSRYNKIKGDRNDLPPEMINYLKYYSL